MQQEDIESGTLGEAPLRSASRQAIQGRIGFVGLGRMGSAMAANLAAGGCHVTAYIRRPGLDAGATATAWLHAQLNGHRLMEKTR